MTLLWTAPREWVTNEPITKEKLNAISNDLTYLMKPTKDIKTVRGSGADVSVTTTSPLPIDALNYLISLELSGERDVTIKLQGLCSITGTTNLMRVDVLIDGTTYLSSLTGTALTHGAWESNSSVAGQTLACVLNVTIPEDILTAAVHTFQPVAWVSAGTMTWHMAAGYFSQFVVGEL